MTREDEIQQEMEQDARQYCREKGGAVLESDEVLAAISAAARQIDLLERRIARLEKDLNE